MNDKVVVLNCVTRLPIPVERVLEGATKAECTELLVVGYDKDGDFYFAASQPGGPDALWLLEQAKLALLNVKPEDL